MKLRRRDFLFGFLGLVTGIEAVMQSKATSAPSSNEIEVSTVEEFFRAIGSNRTIKLTAPWYNLSDLRSELQWTNVFMRQELDGYELVISGVENLKIESLNNQRSLIVNAPTYASILNFENCRNITLDKIEAGHWPKKGTCSGNVLYFSDCEKVHINDSVLFGSGAYGIRALKTQNISIKASVIKECTYGITFLDAVRDFTAQQCRFYNNIGLGALITVENSPGLISFNKCEVYDNYSDRRYGSLSKFLEIEKSKPITLENCVIKNNKFTKFSQEPSLVKLINTLLENNEFQL